MPPRPSFAGRHGPALGAWLLLPLACLGGATAAKPEPTAPAHAAKRAHRAAPLLKRRRSQRITSAPIRIELAPGPVLGFGRQVVRLRVLPLADAPQMDVQVTALRGLAVLRGTRKLSVVARSGQPVTEDLVLGVVGPGDQKLVVTAMLRYPDGQQHGGGTAWVFNPQPHRLTDLHPGSRISVDEEGNEILEVPAK